MYQLEGSIKLISPAQTFPSGFVKREFVVTTDDQYPQDIKLELTKEKCALLDKTLKSRLVDKVIVPAVDLPFARGPRRVRHRKAHIRVFHQTLANRGLARTAGRRNHKGNTAHDWPPPSPGERREAIVSGLMAESTM